MLAQVARLRSVRDEMLVRLPEMGFGWSTRTPTSFCSVGSPTGTPLGRPCWTPASWCGKLGRRVPAGVRRYPGGDGSVLRAAAACKSEDGAHSNRTALDLESTITVEVNLDGTGLPVTTGVGFYDHMLTALAKHSSST